MDILEAIHGRRAVRDFEDQDVDPETLRAVIEAATWAPSGMNRQPWCFYVVEGRQALARFSWKAKAAVMAQAGSHPELSGAMGKLEEPGFNIFYNAPALVVVCATEPDDMALKDCCLASQTLMLAAHAMGLGSCWIGFSDAWLNTPEGKADLGIPEGLRPVAPIIVGYPKTLAPAGTRRAPDIRFVARAT